MSTHGKTKFITTAALMTAVSLTVFLIELQLPPPTPVPGIKYGLANIVTLYILYGVRGTHKPRMAGMVLTARVVLALLLTGRGSAVFMSVCGGAFALIAAVLLYCIFARCREKHAAACIVITGIAGGVAHNAGQLAAAVVVYGLTSAVAYLPYLVLGGVVAGAFTGAAVAGVARLRRGE